MTSVPNLAGNIAAVRARIASAAAQAGREPETVRLVAVSKTQVPERVAAAADAGLCLFGENRVEEALPKMRALAARPGLSWHMLGNIQSRKTRDVAAGGFDLIHSVDSLKLAQRLASQAKESGRILNVLLECNVSGEASKAGFRADDPRQWDTLAASLEPLARLPGLRVWGLMTMAPVVSVPDQARPYFARLRALRDFLARQGVPGDWRELSMGMTDDFEAAITEGATLVRIGRAIFGERR